MDHQAGEGLEWLRLDPHGVLVDLFEFIWHDLIVRRQYCWGECFLQSKWFWNGSEPADVGFLPFQTGWI